MEKKRYANIDLLKTIAILMVIVLHSQLFSTNFMLNNNITTYVQYFLRIACEGVAIFILVNGFLLINKEHFELKKHLKKTLKVFGILIIWSILLTVMVKLIYKEPLNIADIIKNVFVTDINNKYTGILWFLQNLIALYLIYPVLKVLHDNEKKVYDYLFIVLLIFTMLPNLLGLISNLINTKVKFEYINIITSYMSKFQILYNRNFLMFFMIGGYTFENKEKFENKKIRLKWILIGLFSWIMSYLYAIVISKLQNKTYIDSFNYESIFMPCILIGLFALTYGYQNKEKWYNKAIELVAKNSLGIYLLHIIIIRIANSIVPGVLPLILRVIKVLVVFGFSTVLTYIIRKIPVLKKIIEL